MGPEDRGGGTFYFHFVCFEFHFLSMSVFHFLLMSVIFPFDEGSISFFLFDKCSFL